MLTAEERAERARTAALTRHHPDNPGRADDARLRLKVLRAEDYVRGLFTPPVPGIAERARLASLLLGPEGGDADAAA
jgi:hypothetical protein